MLTYPDIRAAADRLGDNILQTPCVASQTLSEITGAQVFLKFENLQFTASFKERGACNRLQLLTAEEKTRGVVAMSAGNHAQGVAYHAQRMGLRAVIVMPRFTPGVKVERTRSFGAEVVLHGDTLEAARLHAYALAEQEQLTFIHPFDDPAVAAGQGTLALEMLAEQPDLDTLIVSVGGGGLIAGVATAAKTLKPSIRVVGVQTRRFPSMLNAVQGLDLPIGQSTIAEGIAVATAGAFTRQVVRNYVDTLLLVDEGDVEQAVLMLLEIEKTLVEGAGAAGLAAPVQAADSTKLGADGFPADWKAEDFQVVSSTSGMSAAVAPWAPRPGDRIGPFSADRSRPCERVAPTTRPTVAAPFAFSAAASSTIAFTVASDIGTPAAFAVDVPKLDRMSRRPAVAQRA